MADDAGATLAQGGEIIDAPEAKCIRDELRSDHANLLEECTPKLFPMPGYRNLHAKYKVIGYEDFGDIGERVGEQMRSEQISDPKLIGLCDTLINACIGFYRMKEVERDGKQVSVEVPLHEVLGEPDSPPVRWGDQRLAELVGLEPTDGQILRARAILRGVLADDMLVVEHAQDVTVWMERERRKVDTDF